MAREISRIDKDINAVHTQLRRYEKIDTMSAASWQDAWDKHPHLHAREKMLYGERYEAQMVRDAAAYKAAMVTKRRENATFRKESAARFKADRAREAASADMLAALTEAFASLQGECGRAFRDLCPATWRRKSGG